MLDSLYSVICILQKNEETPMNKIKSTNPSFLPPCKDSLQQKIKRSNYVAHVWKNDNHSNSVEYQAHNNRWRIAENNKLKIVWFEGPQYPEKFGSMLVKDNYFNDDDEEEEDEKVTCNASSDEDADYHGK